MLNGKKRRDLLSASLLKGYFMLRSRKSQNLRKQRASLRLDVG